METDPEELCFQTGAIDALLPMSLMITPTGHIGHVGPTIAKLAPTTSLVGRRFLEVFAIHRPRQSISDFRGLQAIAGAKLRVVLRDRFDYTMKGVLIEEERSGGLLCNLSFGYSLVEATQQFSLTNGDFSQTDLAIEMLYLIEAKTALMNESRKLNLRLHGARVAAEEQASTDALTGLKNRRAMDKTLARLSAGGTAFGLMHVDLDYFKAVNDTMGHAAGDHVLKVAAKILDGAVRSGDCVARVGGDEFVLVFENIVDHQRLTEIADRIVQDLERPVRFEGQECRISGSIGVNTSTFYPTPDLDQMLCDVDLALYASKHKGRACTTVVTKELLKQVAPAG